MSTHYLNEWDTLGVLAAADRIPAADVLPRDEAIKMGAELAEMHGSDATSQQLEEAYLKGVEDGMTRRDVRPVVRAAWQSWEQDKPPCKWYSCDYCGFHALSKSNYCPNCGADMRGGDAE